MQYWFRTVLGLLLFFGATTAFDYSIFELLSDDPRDSNRLVATIPLAVVAALAGGALFSARGKAPWQVDAPPGFSFAIPWWSAFFVCAGVAAIAAGLGMGGGPDGATQRACFLIGVIFVGMGIAPIVLGLAAPPQRAHGGTAATRVASATGQGFIALLSISVTLGVMERIRDEAPTSPSDAAAELLAPVPPDAPNSLFRELPLGEALDQVGEEDPGAAVLKLRIDPNSLRADLETDSGVEQLLLNRAGQVVSREQLEPVPEESFALDRIDPAVAERIGRTLSQNGGPDLRGIAYMVAISAAADGRPGWAVFARDPQQRPFNLSLDGRELR